jgi:DNA-binding MarR family transcriptional regulator
MATATDTLSLEEQICFALYSASRAVTSRYRDLLEPLGVTYPQYLVLLVLWETGGSTVNGLGERLQLESGTLSPLLRRLEQAGLVTRARTAEDERVVRVTLTPAGSKLRERAASIPQAICESTGLSLDNLVVLRDQVFAVAGSMRASA